MIYISLRFDDGHLSQFTSGYKILKKYNMIGSFYLITNKIGKSRAWPCYSLPYINYDQMKEMENDKNEIGSHSKSHKKGWVNEEDKLKYEIYESLDDLQKHNFNPKTFCFPYSQTSQEAINLCNKHYTAYLAGYTSERIKKGDIVNQFIPSIPTRWGVEKILKAINKKQDKDNEDEWLVIALHEIIDKPSDVGVTEQQFYNIINTIDFGVKKKTHKVITVYDGYKIFR
jgi:peptidoglycan/xylan/chitin deacetylase (PgdA/CDA1 family)